MNHTVMVTFSTHIGIYDYNINIIIIVSIKVSCTYVYLCTVWVDIIHLVHRKEYLHIIISRFDVLLYHSYYRSHKFTLMFNIIIILENMTCNLDVMY